MLTLRQIAEQLGITVARARLCAKSAGVKPIRIVGRIHYYDPSDIQKIEYNHTHFTPTRKRNAKSTASTPTVQSNAEATQRGETAVPTIDPVESDPQALPESLSDLHMRHACYRGPSH